MYENERDRAYTRYDRREGREQSAVINRSRPEALPPSFASDRDLSSKRIAGRNGENGSLVAWIVPGRRSRIAEGLTAPLVAKDADVQELNL
jgi:hypothetical protein